MLGQRFQLRQHLNGMLVGAAANIPVSLELAADRRALRLAKNLTKVFIIQLDTANPGRLTVWHARNGRGNAGRDAASTTT